MVYIFFYSAVIGGTFMTCQLLATVLGLGSDGSEFEIADDLPEVGDVTDQMHSLSDDLHHSNSLFGIISFRTLVAALTFFGLIGMVTNRSGFSLPEQLLSACAAGVGAMFLVHWIMKKMHQLGQSGTLRLSNAIGKVGTVNLTIPADQRGLGKVLMEIQGRFEEFSATTSQSKTLSTGLKVRVVGLQRGNVLEVEVFPCD
ncbi:hypothetical protein SH668x_002254 [Planctomicrobium sp. SH668]|uniref:hypothetical protein n=1 Tax=Planctomicrobium sp. SH668 TaxID=3448126 RepID=UPI003F5BBEEA